MTAVDGALAFAAVVITFTCFLIVGGAVCVVGVALGSCGGEVAGGGGLEAADGAGGLRWGRPASLAFGEAVKGGEGAPPLEGAGRDSFWGRPQGAPAA